MEDNQKNIEESRNEENKQLYSDVKGTGPISTLVFTIVLTIVMYIVSKLLGYS